MLLTLACGVACLASSGLAAGADCPSSSSVVYVSGSSALEPVLVAAQTVLGGSVTIVLQSPGSCQGLSYVLGDAGGVAPPDPDPASVITPPTTTFCDLPGTPAQATVDIAGSDVYPSTCLGFDPNLNPVGTGLRDYLGPVETMEIAVPSASSESAISAAAAYMVFKYAASNAAVAIAPWTVPGDIFTRYYDSATLWMIGAALGDATKFLPGNLWSNARCNPATSTCPQTASSGAQMVNLIRAAAASGAQDASASIGIVSAQNLSAPTDVKPLAFKAVGQSCAYYPDSSLGAGDKINVRQGRYDIWGPMHFVVGVDGSGNPVGRNGNTAAVQQVIDALVSTSIAPAAASGGATLTDAQTGTFIDAISAPPAGGFVPTCAMQVSRNSEVGPEASYMPPAPCGCRFASAATGSPPQGCTACTPADETTVCPGALPVCRFGFCEAQ
jgi:hypothetical protein